MDKLLKAAVFLAVLTGLVIFGYPFGVKVYQNWGKKLIYPASSKITKYPGEGRISQYFGGRIFVSPQTEGKPFFDSIENRSKYPEGPETYRVFEIKAQDQLLYAVGRFEGWEDIDGTSDKYITVKYPAGGIEKYRIAFEDSELFGDNATSLAVEDVAVRLNKDKNATEKPIKFKLTDLGYDAISRAIRKGDAVILVPLFDPPDLSKEDANQIPLASWLIIRRVGGAKALTVSP